MGFTPGWEIPIEYFTDMKENWLAVSLSIVILVNLLKKVLQEIVDCDSISLFISPLRTFPRWSTIPDSSVESHLWQIVLYHSVRTLLPLLVLALAHPILTYIFKATLSLCVWKLSFAPGHCYDMTYCLSLVRGTASKLKLCPSVFLTWYRTKHKAGKYFFRFRCLLKLEVEGKRLRDYWVPYCMEWLGLHINSHINVSRCH